MKRHIVKKVLILFAILLMILSSAGCWSQRELNTIAIVSGIGIDLEKVDGRQEIKLTAQIVKPSELKTSGKDEQKGGGSSPVLVLESTGDTVFDAVRNFTLESSRRLFFPHNQVIIVGEEAAREGIQPLLDFFVRDHENRGRLWILVARGKAGDILKAKVGQEKIPAMGIADLEEASFVSSKTYATRLQDFINVMMSETTSPVVSVISFNNQENRRVVGLEGSAFFKGGKLAGFLDEAETRGLLWVQGKVKSGIVLIDSPDSGKKASIEITRASSKIRPGISNGKVSIEVIIKAEGDLGDQTGVEELASPEKIPLLEKKQGEMIKREVEAALNKARQYRADIFGFGEMVHKNNPKEWQDIKQNWEEIFSDIKVKITVVAKVRRAGMTIKPIMPE